MCALHSSSRLGAWQLSADACHLAGYSVEFREFQGGHEVNEETAMDAMSWFEAPPLNDTMLDFSCS